MTGSDRGTGASAHFVVFNVEGERFALRSDQVERVLERVQLRPLPWLPAPAVGVLSHRGGWIPAFDPAVPLGLSAVATARRSALVLRRGSARFALSVDVVTGQRNLRAQRLQEAEGTRTVSSYAELEQAEVLSDEHGLIALVDPAVLLPGQAREQGGKPMDQEQTLSTVSVVAFRSGGAALALPVERVAEVFPYRTPRPLEGAPAFVEGVVDLRGNMVPVVRLGAVLGLEQEDDAAAADLRILVVRVEDVLVGLVVGEVSDVRRVSADAVAPPPSLLREFAGECVDGVIQVEDSLLLLLRPDRLLSPAQREQLGDSGG